MRKLYFLVVVLALTSCGGSISDEQRKQMLEARELQSIQKVTDVQITEAAFEKGREVVNRLNENISAHHLDSIATSMDVNIRWLVPGAANAHEIESQLIDAYINSVLMGEEQVDNVQRVGKDSLLYTKALVITRPDSSIEVKGTWNVWISKKKLILSMAKK
jgi:hypothetical protein